MSWTRPSPAKTNEPKNKSPSIPTCQKTMNDPQNPYPYERPNSVASPAEANPPVSNPLADIRKPVPNHRHGRVARLPKATRDKLNEMILDGFAYKEIIQALAQEAKSLNEDALTKWRHGGGYQE